MLSHSFLWYVQNAKVIENSEGARTYFYCSTFTVYIKGQKMLKTTLRLSSVQERDEDRNKMKLNALRIQNITLPSQIDLRDFQPTDLGIRLAEIINLPNWQKKS
ncbi:hypothetical protein FRX31_029991 [Thalictrum thalictroides]|uniref:Uncharacterized protein n=1 Tax=Thalictrum thalictroides TaxID=46969 RepID=A0A7J6V7P4_THATH|nr:hypothetical protein FRX31_029991 [Thalictrum thalictroides]